MSRKIVVDSQEFDVTEEVASGVEAFLKGSGAAPKSVMSSSDITRKALEILKSREHFHKTFYEHAEHIHIPVKVPLFGIVTISYGITDSYLIGAAEINLGEMPDSTPDVFEGVFEYVFDGNSYDEISDSFREKYKKFNAAVEKAEATIREQYQFIVECIEGVVKEILDGQALDYPINVVVDEIYGEFWLYLDE